MQSHNFAFVAGMKICFGMLGFFSLATALTIAWVELHEWRKRRAEERALEADAAFAGGHDQF